MRRCPCPNSRKCVIVDNGEIWWHYEDKKELLATIEDGFVKIEGKAVSSEDWVEIQLAGKRFRLPLSDAAIFLAEVNAYACRNRD